MDAVTERLNECADADVEIVSTGRRARVSKQMM